MEIKTRDDSGSITAVGKGGDHTGWCVQATSRHPVLSGLPPTPLTLAVIVPAAVRGALALWSAPTQVWTLMIASQSVEC